MDAPGGDLETLTSKYSENKIFKHKEVPLGLRRLTELRSDPFTFKFPGATEPLVVKCLLAEYLSPKIERLRSMDCSVDEFMFSPPPNSDIPRLRQTLEKLVTLAPIEVTYESYVPLLTILADLENTELFNAIQGMDIYLLEINDVISLIRAHEAYNLGDISMLVDWLAERVHEMREELDNIDGELLCRLLESPKLKIESEEWLCRFLLSRAKKDLRYCSLFRHILLEYVPKQTIEELRQFLLFSDEIDGNDVVLFLRWIHETLQEGNSKGEPNGGRYLLEPDGNCIRVPFDGEHPWSDIVQLFRDAQERQDKHGVILTSHRARFRHWDLDDWHEEELEEELEGDAFVQVEFKEDGVMPEYYYLENEDSHFDLSLTDWKLEGRLADSDQWDILDWRYDQDLSTEKKFEVQGNVNAAYKYIRLRQVGLSTTVGTGFALHQFRIYGHYRPDASEGK